MIGHLEQYIGDDFIEYRLEDINWIKGSLT
ncbi:hypothetical protein ACEQPO_06180 [Bacillus sp. SL00103]